MDTRTAIETWIAVLQGLQKLQESGIKVRAAVEQLKAQAPQDLDVQRLISRCILLEQTQSEAWQMIPP